MSKEKSQKFHKKISINFTNIIYYNYKIMLYHKNYEETVFVCLNLSPCVIYTINGYQYNEMRTTITIKCRCDIWHARRILYIRVIVIIIVRDNHVIIIIKYWGTAIYNSSRMYVVCTIYFMFEGMTGGRLSKQVYCILRLGYIDFLSKV